MANIPADYPISRKEVWVILTAGLQVAEKKKDWNTAGAIVAMRDRVMELKECFFKHENT